MNDLAAFARRVSNAQRERNGFQARQRTIAGPIDVSAHVRVRDPHLIAVEFRSFANPLLDLEEQLFNGAEYTPDELKAMSFFVTERETTAFDPVSNVVLHRPGFAIPEPLPGFRALGAVGFLSNLTADFLLREETTDADRERELRRIGIKPKAPVRSELLSVTSFPFRRGSLLVEERTLFPRRIEFVPSGETLLASLLGPKSIVSIDYADVRQEAPEPAAFDFRPTEGTRVFYERSVSLGDVSDQSPFPCHLDPLVSKGYSPRDEGCRLAVDRDNGRGHLQATLSMRNPNGETAAVTVRAGNYLSRNMSRRRAALAGGGEEVDLSGRPGRFLDRTANWPEAVAAPEHGLLEIGWEINGTHWFMLGEGIDRTQLVDLATDLVLVGSAG